MDDRSPPASSALSRLAAGVAMAVLAILALAGPAAAAEPTPARGHFAGPVEIEGGRDLYMECRGRGAPTVILEAGLRSRGDFWSVKADPGQSRVVFDAIAERTRVCEYDRPGTTLGTDEFSRSDPVEQPRTARDAARDLQALIAAAKLPGPFVLVGHSTGGVIVRLYAALAPRRVAGIVLVDALPEAMKPAMNSGDWQLFRALNVEPPPGLEDYAALETIDFDRSFRQMNRARHRHPLRRGLPLVVISRGRPPDLGPGLPPGFPEALERAWRIGQNALARLVPHAERWIAGHSGHYVMFDQPAIVIRAIGRVLREAR